MPWPRSSARRAWWVVVVAAVALAAAPAPGHAGQATILTASDFVELISTGGLVELADVTIQGDVDLRPMGSVAQPVRCTRCRLTGGLLAPRVVFERSVEFVHSEVDGEVLLDGALFKDRLSFEATAFARPASFRWARFRDTVWFSEAEFADHFWVDGSRFASLAFFAQSRFGRDASFQVAEFEGKAEFDRVRFGGSSVFEGASFRAFPSFISARFARRAQFTGAELRDGATFEFASFAEGFELDRVTAAGALRLNSARVVGDAGFGHFNTSGTLTLDDFEIDGGRLYLDQASVRDLSMSLAKVDRLPNVEVQKEVLRVLRRSAEERGDLSLANRATYMLRSIAASEEQGRWERIWDIAYRRLGGYLVRPLNPLVSLLAVLTLASGVRCAWGVGRAVAAHPAVRRRLRRSHRFGRLFPGESRLTADDWRSPPGEIAWRRRRSRTSRTLGVATAALGAVSRSASMAFRRAPGIVLVDRNRTRSYVAAGLVLGEYLAYKVLLACFLLALGKANPTFRELINSVAT